MQSIGCLRSMQNGAWTKRLLSDVGCAKPCFPQSSTPSFQKPKRGLFHGPTNQGYDKKEIYCIRSVLWLLRLVKRFRDGRL